MEREASGEELNNHRGYQLTEQDIEKLRSLNLTEEDIKTIANIPLGKRQFRKLLTYGMLDKGLTTIKILSPVEMRQSLSKRLTKKLMKYIISESITVDEWTKYIEPDAKNCELNEPEISTYFNDKHDIEQVGIELATC